MSASAFAVGDLVAWESQAAGSWKTKIGRIVRIPSRPRGLRDQNAHKFADVEVLASYHTPDTIGEAQDGMIRGGGIRKSTPIKVVRHKEPKAMRPFLTSLRAPRLWERAQSAP